MAVDDPVVGPERVRIRCVIAKVIVGDGDGTISRDVHRRRKGSGVARGLIDLNGSRPGKTAVGRHREGDVIVRGTAKASVLPNDEKDAAAGIDRDSREPGASSHGGAGVWINHLNRTLAGSDDGGRPGRSVVSRAHDGLEETGCVQPGSLDEVKDVDQRTVWENGNLMADGKLVALRREDCAGCFPRIPSVDGA